ncbi:MAG TPA: hypothetical protein VHV08_10535, partial [Pirellulales bacterium]|nr:hypothetical protein [Pirellulales bacterium]
RAVEWFAPQLGSQTIQWVSVGGRLEEFVAALRSLMLDLIYHWEIGTDGVNYFLPFFRLAPVQCTSWGIQVTSGIPGVDYYLSSKLVEPDDAQDHYTEKLVLSDTLLSYQRRAPLALGPAKRESLGIANDTHLYLCAQQLGKFHPDFDPILAGILQADARAVIVVTEDRHGGPAKEDLRQRFASRMQGDASRIKFVPFQPADRYLSLTAAADVVLDPLHFGGVNTTYDAFSLHQPIVTLPSRYQRGRYTLGCYQKMGIFDCVASDPRQYVEIAVALANDRDFHGRVVDQLRAASPVLFEDQAAVSEHERIFGDLIARARAERI